MDSDTLLGLLTITINFLFLFAQLGIHIFAG